jgi:predicted nuclease with RNAse H fold
VEPILAIGWDVGGWMGVKHGWPICEVRDDGTLHWPFSPVELGIGPTGEFDLDEIIRRLSGSNGMTVDGQRVVVAVDAPLGFPAQFRRLLCGETVEFVFPDREIESELAYRETDRNVHDRLGKKPLSAAFDKLGNNATVAMVHAQRWRERHGFSVPPLTEVGDLGRVIIEVYPALAKDPRTGEARGVLARLIPPDVKSGTDAYDAAICALHAAKFGSGQALRVLPPLVGPERVTEAMAEEGWIYYFSPDELDTHDGGIPGGTSTQTT